MAELSKKTRGKQVIEIKRIEEENDRMVTFSKRKSGIYKKANELATLIGAQVGVVVFSPSGKPYSFGHPSFKIVSNRFLNSNIPANDNTQPLIEAYRQVRIAKRNEYHNDLLSQLEAEKEHGKIMEEITKGKSIQGWWENSIGNLSVDDLLQMDKAFDDLSKLLHTKLNQMKLRSGGASSSSFPPMNILQRGS